MIRITLVFWILSAAVLFVLVGLPAHANGRGEIRFYGSIVEPSCQVDMAFSPRQIHLDCSNRSDSRTYSTGEVAHADMVYIDAKKTLIMVNTTYH